MIRQERVVLLCRERENGKSVVGREIVLTQGVKREGREAGGRKKREEALDYLSERRPRLPSLWIQSAARPAAQDVTAGAAPSPSPR